jgi:hypothetical protein
LHIDFIGLNPKLVVDGHRAGSEGGTEDRPVIDRCTFDGNGATALERFNGAPQGKVCLQGAAQPGHGEMVTEIGKEVIDQEIPAGHIEFQKGLPPGGTRCRRSDSAVQIEKSALAPRDEHSGDL